MYSQYNYQSHVGGATTQTTMAPPVQATSLSWNGTQWVSIASSFPATINAPAQFHHHHQQQQQQHQPIHSHINPTAAVTNIPPPKTKLPPTPVHLKHRGDESLMTLDQLVSHYSLIYHHYAAEVSSFNDHNNTNVVAGSTTKAWAVYHCDLSARAAHHYNDLLHNRNNVGTKLGGTTQVKDINTEQQKELSRGHHHQYPPTPIHNTTTATAPTPIETKTNTLTTSTTPSKDTPLEEDPPESFRRYAHKNLRLCHTETQRKAMQELLTMTMDRAIQKQEFHGTDWDYESLLPVPPGGELQSSTPLQQDVDVADNKMNNKPHHTAYQPEERVDDSEDKTKSSFPAEVSSEFKSLKRKHTSFEYGENNHVPNTNNQQNKEQGKASNSPITETASNLSSQQGPVNDWDGNDITNIRNENDTKGSAVNSDTQDVIPCTKTLKNVLNNHEQKTTLDDWYGGSGEGDSSTNTGASQSGACITFEPKVFKKKKKKRYQRGGMNYRRPQVNSTATEETKVQKNYQPVTNNIATKENGNESHATTSQNKVFHLVPNGNNGCAGDNNHVSSPIPLRDPTREHQLKYDTTANAQQLGNKSQQEQEETVSDWYANSSPQQLKRDATVVAQQSNVVHQSNAKSQQEQKETVSDWYANSGPKISPPSSISPLKKEINMQDQKQTLNDWYGGDNSIDGKNKGEATITFKPKPLKKKKKKIRKYMKRSLAVPAPKIKVLSTRDNNNDFRMNSGKFVPCSQPPMSGNGITMLPPVQSGSTAVGTGHYQKSYGTVKREGFSEINVNNNRNYDLHQENNLHDNFGRAHRVQPPLKREEDYMPLNRASSNTTTQHVQHHETETKQKFYNYSEAREGGYSPSQKDTTIERDHQPQKNRTGRWDVSSTDSNQNNHLHRCQVQQTDSGAGNEFENSEIKTTHNSVTAYQLTQSNNDSAKTVRFSTCSSPVSNASRNMSNSRPKNSKHPAHGFERSKTKLASRASRFAATSSNPHIEYIQDADRYMGKSVIGGTLDKILTEEDYEKMTVKGHCEVLEKSYLRLTSPPRAALVRPQRILRRHLTNLKKKWLQYRTNLYITGNKHGCSDDLSYTWFCSQLKAIRQDLTVQRIFNAFAVDVYETHAKIALQENDLNEYNQSQTQLKELYALLSHQALTEEEHAEITGLEHQNEFIAYRIIYHIFLTGNQKYDGGSSDLLKIMISLTPAQRKDAAIAHALNVRVAVAEHDYHAFFKLQDVCPNLGAYLMDTLVPQVRSLGLKYIMKAYRPSIAVMFILQELGFSVDEADVEGGKAWLSSCGCKFSNDRSMIMTKESNLNEIHLVGVNNSSLI